MYMYYEKYIKYKKKYETLKNEIDILYLVHVTNNNPYNYRELKTSKYNINDQFPGVYFSLITKDNIDIENLFQGSYIMIFSCNLLKQKNYHINIRDYNGFITENNTYYPWSLHKAVKQIKSYSLNENTIHSNEVVFHDNISYNYLCKIIKYKTNLKLPKFICLTSTPPDLTKLPFYAFCFENKYTGIDPLQPSSLDFFIKMAKLAKLNPIPKTIEEIVKQIEDKVPYLLVHRYEQNLNILKKK
jgi:hypothetical protein